VTGHYKVKTPLPRRSKIKAFASFFSGRPDIIGKASEMRGANFARYVVNCPAAMTVTDYLIDHQDFDWATLLSGWCWLLPEEITVWLMNRFGDLFLVFNDGTVWMLDCGVGTLEQLAKSRDDFCVKIDGDGNADDWLMIPLVNQLVEAGISISEGRCYSFRIPPIIGGEYSVENTVTLPISEHYDYLGSIHEQMEGLPDGTKVRLRIINSELSQS
jgi:hypothetical protein